MPQSFKIFISSTWESAALTALRQELTRELRDLGHQPLMMDRDGALAAAPGPAVHFSVEGCDVLVGIYGSRYGSLRPGGSESFTEYEFDTATRGRKRRLCYFLGEDAGAPPPEPEEKQQAQRRFREKIDRHLVRMDFSKHGSGPEAWAELRSQVLRDIRRLESGAPLGVTHAEVREAWVRHWTGPTRRESPQLREIWKHLADWQRREEEGVGNSWHPLMFHWSGFLQAEGWHEVVGHQLRSIQQAASTLGLRALAERCLAVDLRRNCNEIRERLALLVSRQELGQLHQLIESKERALGPARPRAASKGVKEKLQAAKQLRRELQGLQRQVESPTYGRCFLVAGKQGAGKTHFIEAALARLASWEEAPLVVPVGPGGSIERLLPSIMDALRAHTGVAWRDLDEVDRFLAGEYEPEGSPPPPPMRRLVIAIDDLHTWMREQPGLLDALLNLIKDHTRLRRVDWLLAIQSSHLEKLITGPLAQDWWQYGFMSRLAASTSRADAWLSHDAWSVRTSFFQEALPHVGGWLSLDELNTRERVGLQILHSHLLSDRRGATREQLWFLDEIREGRVQQVPPLLHEPFIAWTALSLPDLQLKDLLNVSFIEFVEAFWSRYQSSLERLLEERKRCIAPDVPARELLEGAVHLTASVMALAGRLELVRPLLERRIAEAARDMHSLADPALVKHTLEVLIQANLLEESTAASGDPPGLPVNRLRLRTETFWELQLARQLRLSPELAGSGEEEALRFVRGWFDQLHAEDVREGTFGFLLLLLSRHAQPLEATRRGLMESLWHFDAAPEFRAAAWFAAPRAATAVQARLARESRIVPGHSGSVRELFAFMYFMCEAGPDVLDMPRRLEALNPLLPSIGAAGLTAYYRYIVECLLGRELEVRKVLAALRHLSGCEVLDARHPGLTESLADAVVATLVRLSGRDSGQVVGILLGYLQSSRESTVMHYRPRRVKRTWTRYFFLEWLLNRFCIWLVMSGKLAGYTLLEQRQWFRPGELELGHELGEELDREANIALGHWYATASRPEEKSAFRQYVTGLGRRPWYADVRRACHILSHCGYAAEHEAGELHGLRAEIEERFRRMTRPGTEKKSGGRHRGPRR
ncbi:DUF4062 domain-containing protein [Pyxidicoccus trucidator]|uniref:DUF4062 domain-containing protein n=1 Tax=Pyxidicoccus trucidator TaxID=2709662 RepID=UPI0013DC2E56|nr:DUF4062 domain-containing protein [Pyxidicoccus trucidator]